MDRSEFRFNPEMLKLAREARGLTQTGLAEVAHVSQDYISKYENGLLPISPRHLRRLCEALQLPEKFFEQADRTSGFGSSPFHDRARRSLRVRVRAKELARVNIRRIAISRLLAGLEMEPVYEFPKLEIDDFGGKVERIAAEVRRVWGLPAGPVQNVTRCIEDAGGVVSLCQFETGQMDGLSQWLPNLPPMFFINERKPGDRIRYTLAHEIGHMVMHHVSTEFPEPEADRFAAEFLMPEADIKGTLRVNSLDDLARLKVQWKVSMAALLRRARDLKEISPDTYQRLNIYIAKAGYKVHEPIPIPLEEPALVRMAFDLHFDSFKYTMDDFTNMMALPETDIRREFARELKERLNMAGIVLRPKGGKDLEVIPFDHPREA